METNDPNLQHWKKNLDPNWIGCYVLPDGNEINVVLKNVEFKKNVKVGGNVKDAHIGYFEPNQYFDKPMILNKTNLKRLSFLTGKTRPIDWVNLPLTLCQELDKTVTGGKDWALRIKPVLPTLKSDVKALTMLNSSTTLAELKANWDALTYDERALPTVIAAKEELKLKLK